MKKLLYRILSSILLLVFGSIGVIPRDVVFAVDSSADFNTTALATAAIAPGECTANAAKTNSCQFDDWVVSSEPPTLCGGYYVELTPPFPGIPSEKLTLEPVAISADRAEFQDKGPSTLLGHVHLTQGNRQVFADQAKVYRAANTKKLDKVEATGDVRLIEPGLRLCGRFAEISFKDDYKKIEDATFRIYERHARGVASTITAFGKNRFELCDATYTTCSPLDTIWELSAEKITLDRETGKGQAYGARMKIKDIPVLYSPYLSFPIDRRRKTGFLFPSIGYSNNSGFELATPFYWNLAPNYDATLTPRWLSKRGADLQGQFRYLWPQGTGEIAADYLPYDKAYASFKAANLSSPEFPRQDPRVTALTRASNARGAFAAKHTSTFNQNWCANVNYQVVSDDNYFMDLGNTLGVAGNTQVLQEGQLNYQDEYWLGRGRVQSYQTLHPYFGPVNTTPYKRLPQLALINYYPDLPLCLEWQALSEFTHFSHPKDPRTGAEWTTGERYFFRPGLGYNLASAWGFFKPRVQLDTLWYSLKLGSEANLRGQRNNLSRVLPIVDIDSGLIFERSCAVAETNFVQTLEPRAYYLYVPFKNQNNFPNFDTTQPGFDFNQLYRDNRFSGIDRLGDANQVTLGLSTRLLCAQSGLERFYASLGEIFYFKKRKVHLRYSPFEPAFIHEEQYLRRRRSRARSPLAGFARLQLIEAWYANLGLEWDTYRQKTDKAAFWLQYHPEELNVVNLGYQYLRRNPVRMLRRGNGLSDRIHQVEGSVAWAITDHWRILGRSNYDVINSRMNEILAGLEHQGCCTALRFSFVRYLLPNDGQKRYSHGFFFQFVFKGLGGIGNHRVGSTLSRAIPGYVWRSDRF